MYFNKYCHNPSICNKSGYYMRLVQKVSNAIKSVWHWERSRKWNGVFDDSWSNIPALQFFAFSPAWNKAFPTLHFLLFASDGRIDCQSQRGSSCEKQYPSVKDMGKKPPSERTGKQSRGEEDFFHWHDGKNTLDLDCGRLSVKWRKGLGQSSGLIPWPQFTSCGTVIIRRKDNEHTIQVIFYQTAIYRIQKFANKWKT